MQAEYHVGSIIHALSLSVAITGLSGRSLAVQVSTLEVEVGRVIAVSSVRSRFSRYRVSLHITHTPPITCTIKWVCLFYYELV